MAGGRRKEEEGGWLKGRSGAEGRSGPPHRAVSAEENGTEEQ